MDHHIEAQEENQPTKPEDGLRRQANIQGAALLIYQSLLNICVFVAAVAGTVVELMGQTGDNQPGIEEIVDSAMDATGWGYLLAVAIGLLVLLIWKKPTYFRDTICKAGKRMTIGIFFALLSLTMAPQLIAQLCDLTLRWLLDIAGRDASAPNLLFTVDVDTGAMFFYIGIAAPIAEELLFRGLLLRSIASYGKKLAIVASALLFGLFHSNPIQTPYAIGVGLVLGYVALEYHILWAIVLHLFNNLVFALLLPRALSFLPTLLIDSIWWLLIIVFFLAAVLVLAAKWDRLTAIWKEDKVEAWQRKAFFHAPTVVILMVLCLLGMACTTLLLFLA